MSTLSLKKFDINKLHNNPSVCIIIGRRGTGKSVLACDLLTHMGRNTDNVVFTSSNSEVDLYRTKFPSETVYDEYGSSLIKNIVNGQRLKKETKELTTIVLDSGMYTNEIDTDNVIRDIYINHIRYQMSLILSIQHPLEISPALRSNSEYVFILRDANEFTRKKLHVHYAGIFPTFKSFCQILDQTTENYDCMVICNNSKSIRIEDQVFWYKAEL